VFWGILIDILLLVNSSCYVKNGSDFGGSEFEMLFIFDRQVRLFGLV